jgi:hypothetical protein
VTAASRPQKTRLNDATATQLTGFSKKKAHDLRKSASFQSLLLIAFIYLSLVVEGLR